MRKIIVLGMGRSGTTWLGSILDSNPNILYKNEPFGGFHQRFPWSPFDRRYFDLKKEKNVNKIMIDKALDVIFSDYSAFKKGHKFYFSKNYRNNSKLHEVFSRFSFNELTDHVLKKIFVNSEQKNIVLALKEVRLLAEFFQYYSNEKSYEIIYQFRNPFSFYNSVFNNEVYTKGRLDAMINIRIKRIFDVLNNGASHFINENFYRLLIDRYLNENKQMIFVIYWCVMNEYYFNEYSKCENVYFNKFEDLANDPNTTVVNIFNKLGLHYGEETKLFLRKSSSTKGPIDQKSREGFYQGVEKNSKAVIDKWRKNLNDSEISMITEIVENSNFYKEFYGNQINL